MKKYNLLIAISLIIYIVIAAGFGTVLLHVEEQNDHTQYVEVNRIMATIKDANDIQTLDMDAYDHIKRVSYMDMNEQDKGRIQAFFNDGTSDDSMIRPFYIGNEQKGYIKFTYQAKKLNTLKIQLLIQIPLFMMELLLLVCLFYLKKNVVRPFLQVQTLPQQLLHGHYKHEIYYEKSKYFQEYTHGLSLLKDELDLSSKRQMELLKEKKQMLLSLSHDIKTPLNMIKLYAKALNENIYDDDQSRVNALKQIGVKCEEIEHYVNAIMKSSREDIFEFEVEQGEFYLADLMNSILDVYIPRLTQRNIHYEISKYENRLLKGDLHRAQEVMENILENAIKYGDGKWIQISLYEEDYCQLIRIYNSGTTLSDQEMNHLFDSFYRGTNAKGKQGNGLGLSICQNLMRKMDGAIYAEKRKDGMAFVLVFR